MALDETGIQSILNWEHSHLRYYAWVIHSPLFSYKDERCKNNANFSKVSVLNWRLQKWKQSRNFKHRTLTFLRFKLFNLFTNKFNPLLEKIFHHYTIIISFCSVGFHEFLNKKVKIWDETDETTRDETRLTASRPRGGSIEHNVHWAHCATSIIPSTFGDFRRCASMWGRAAKTIGYTSNVKYK